MIPARLYLGLGPAPGTSGRIDPVFPGLPQIAQRAARAGARLQAAGAAWIEGREDAASEHLLAAAADLPRALLAPNAPDATASEVWPAE